MKNPKDSSNVSQLFPDRPTFNKGQDTGGKSSFEADAASTVTGSSDRHEIDIDAIVRDVQGINTQGPGAAARPSPQPSPTPSGVAEHSAAPSPRTGPGRRIGPRTGKATRDNEYFYILTIGRAGSGKSTFQSHLLRYLMTQGDHQVQLDVEHAQESSEFHETEQKWRRQWQNGLFPDPTAFNRPAEFRYNVMPHRKGFPPVKFGFIEISGEDFNKLSDANFHEKEFLESIDDFLNNPSVHLAFLFVCQGAKIGDDDILFGNFLHYLAMRTDRQFSEQSCAVLVLADPPACQAALADRLKQPRLRNKPLDIERFIDEFTPVSAAALAGWKNRATIATFSVGDVAQDRNGKAQIAKPDFEDAKAIYDWLYERYTGRKMGDGFVAKTVAFLKSLGGG